MSINNYLRNETAQFLPSLKDGASLGNEVKQTQTNGKLERFFGEYENQRSAFRSFEDFIGRYNDTGLFLRRKKAK
jgi:hypothetical protein